MTAIRNATPEAELERASAAAEPEKGRWSQMEQLLAILIDVQRQALYAFHVANSDKKARRGIEPPEPVRRPGSRPPRKKTTPLTEERADRLFRLINGGAA